MRVQSKIHVCKYIETDLEIQMWKSLMNGENKTLTDIEWLSSAGLLSGIILSNFQFWKLVFGKRYIRFWKKLSIFSCKILSYIIGFLPSLHENRDSGPEIRQIYIIVRA